jgi:hypothetical protein
MMRIGMIFVLMESVPMDWSPWLIAGVGAAALVLVILRAARGVHDQRRSSDAAPEPTEPSPNSVERDITRLMQELSEMARQVGSQLDARAARLEKLLRQADERIAAIPAQQRDDDAAPRTDGGAESNAVLAPRLEALEPAGVAADPAHAAAADPRHRDIYALADAGHDAPEIAARLGRPSGEIELILALRTKD